MPQVQDDIRRILETPQGIGLGRVAAHDFPPEPGLSIEERVAHLEDAIRASTEAIKRLALLVEGLTESGRR
jgi:hypothetical protein